MTSLPYEHLTLDPKKVPYSVRAEGTTFDFDGSRPFDWSQIGTLCRPLIEINITKYIRRRWIEYEHSGLNFYELSIPEHLAAHNAVEHSKPKSKYKIHIPKNPQLPTDAFFARHPQRSSSSLSNWRRQLFCTYVYFKLSQSIDEITRRMISSTGESQESSQLYLIFLLLYLTGSRARRCTQITNHSRWIIATERMNY